MKQAAIAILIVIVIYLGFGFWTHHNSRDYREAEPLVQLVWPLAYEMKRFVETEGRDPVSLDEMTKFTNQEDSLKRRDFSLLSKYEHSFSPSGERRFFLRVNDRYSFEIDSDYAPDWVHAVGAEQASAGQPEKRSESVDSPDLNP